MTNIRNELTYYNKELMDSELREAVNISSVGNIESLNEEDNDNVLLNGNEDILAYTTLIIEDFIDLQNPIFQGETGLHEEPNTPIINEENNNDMDFDLVNLVDDILSSRLE